MYALLDDGFYDAPRFGNVPNECIGVWAKGLAYCNRHLTDGYIPERVARAFVERVPNATLEQSDPSNVLAEMVKSGLWKRLNGGFSHVGYLDHNRSKDAVLAMRESSKHRKEKWKLSHPGTRSERDPGTVPNPIRSNPIQPNIESERASAPAIETVVARKPRRSKAQTAMTEAWAPPQDETPNSWHQDARRHGLTTSEVETALQEFKLHYVARGELRADWVASWRTWLGRVRQYSTGVRRQLRPGNGSHQQPAPAGQEGWAPRGLVGAK